MYDFLLQKVAYCTHTSVLCFLHLTKYLGSYFILQYYNGHLMAAYWVPILSSFPEVLRFSFTCSCSPQSFQEARHPGLTGQNSSILSILLTHISLYNPDKLQDSCLESWGRGTLFALGMVQETLIMVDKSPTTM